MKCMTATQPSDQRKFKVLACPSAIDGHGESAAGSVPSGQKIDETRGESLVFEKPAAQPRV